VRGGTTERRAHRRTNQERGQAGDARAVTTATAPARIISQHDTNGFTSGERSGAVWTGLRGGTQGRQRPWLDDQAPQKGCCGSHLRSKGGRTVKASAKRARRGEDSMARRSRESRGSRVAQRRQVRLPPHGRLQRRRRTTLPRTAPRLQLLPSSFL
jgi:hypothetical protein